MVAPTGRLKSTADIAVVLFCISCFHAASTTSQALDSPRGPEIARGNLEEDMAEFFRTVVRKRRQLPKRRDLDKKGFEEIERQAMLALHNAYRSTVSPPAANMIELRWNYDIEGYAQEWSDMCVFRHRGSRNFKEWKNMGENLYFTSVGRYSEKEAVDLWWNEHEHYDYETKRCAKEPCSHYITAAWATSEFIGCGITRCNPMQDPDLGREFPAYLFVCYYSGTFTSGTRPFQKGKSCSNCRATYPRCRYNLCVTEEMLTGCEGYNGTTIYISEKRVNSVTDPMNCPGFVDDNAKPDPTTGGQTSEGQATGGQTAGGQTADVTSPPASRSSRPDPTSGNVVTTDSSNSRNTTAEGSRNTTAEGEGCRVMFSSILTTVLCLTSCLLFVP